MIRYLNSCSRYANRSCSKLTRKRPSWARASSREVSIFSQRFRPVSSPLGSDRIHFKEDRLFSSLRHDVSDNDVSIESGSAETVSRKNTLLDSFAKQTIKNVSEIIKYLDNKETKSGRRIRISDRWKKLISIERRRYKRQNGQEQKPMSVDELWAEALEEANIPFNDLASEVPPSLSETPDRNLDYDETNSSETLSPIFGLHLDEEGKLQESLPRDDAATIDVDAILREQQTSYTSNHGKKNAEAMLRAIALLSAFRADEWDILDSNNTFESSLSKDEMDSEPKPGKDPAVADLQPTTMDGIGELFEDIEVGKYLLTTEESNVLLALMVTSMDASVDNILNDSLQLFDQMRVLGHSGREECGPDVNTFRILILALSRRLMANGEALKLSQEFFECGLEVTPETFLNCMETCFERNDLAAATGMLSAAIKNNPQFRPPVVSYLRIIDMMKRQNLQSNALNLIEQARELNGLGLQDEVKLLSSLCHWPMRSRRGDLIDTAPLLHKILYTLEGISNGLEKPDGHVWTTLINRLSRQAKSGNSHWKDVIQAVNSFLTLYPDIAPSPILLRQGLDAGEAMLNASVIARIIDQQLRLQEQKKEFPHGIVENSHESENGGEIPSIPQGVFRRGLQICIRSGDTKSATRLFRSFKTIKEYYPIQVQADMFGLALLCFTSAGLVENAKEVFFDMIETGMEPSEELHGVVLCSLVVNNKVDEAFGLFRKMEEQQSGLMPPGTSSYNAILLAHVRSKSWDAALSHFEEMKAKDISPSPQTIQSLVLATYKTGGKRSVSELLESLLATGESIFDERTFLLAARVLIPNAPGHVDGIRTMLREIGDTNKTLRRPALDLTRSLRSAQVEQKKRESTDHHFNNSLIESEGVIWHSAMEYLLTLARASSSAAPNNNSNR